MKKNPKRNQTNERKRPSCQKFTLFKEEFSPTQLRAFPQKTCVICTFLNKTETHKQTRGSERGNFSHLLLSFSLERHKVPFRIGFLPFYVSPPPSPHLIASASMTASSSLTVLLNLFTKLVLT